MNHHPPRLLVASLLLLAPCPAAARSGWLGVKEGDSKGARIESVLPGSPAHRAGLQPGDVVSRYDGQPVGSVADLRRLEARSKAGLGTNLTFERGGIRFDYGITPGVQPSRRRGRQGRRANSFGGGPAPPLSVAHWYRRPATPSGGVEGEVRLIQFWATW